MGNAEKFDKQMNKAWKKAQRKVWLENKVNDAAEWLDKNKEAILTLTTFSIPAVGTLARTISRNARLKKEKNLKDLYCYDRSLGHYWSLRRELTNREWTEIDRRKKNGERLADILSAMKVLK